MQGPGRSELHASQQRVVILDRDIRHGLRAGIERKVYVTIDQTRHHGYAVAEIVDQRVSRGRRPAGVDTGDQASLCQHYARAPSPLSVEDSSGSNRERL